MVNAEVELLEVEFGLDKATEIKEVHMTNATPSARPEPAEGLPPVPPRPLPPTKSATHRYYDANKAQIISELERFGNNPTCRRWSIGGGTMTGLKRRWGLPVTARPRLPKALTPSKRKAETDTGKTVAISQHEKVELGPIAPRVDDDGPTALLFLRLRPGDGVGGIRFTWLDSDGAVIGKRDR